MTDISAKKYDLSLTCCLRELTKSRLVLPFLGAGGSKSLWSQTNRQKKREGDREGIRKRLWQPEWGGNLKNNNNNHNKKHWCEVMFKGLCITSFCNDHATWLCCLTTLAGLRGKGLLRKLTPNCPLARCSSRAPSGSRVADGTVPCPQPHSTGYSLAA